MQYGILHKSNTSFNMGIVHFDERPGIFNEFFAKQTFYQNAGARGSWRARRLYHFQLFWKPYAEPKSKMKPLLTWSRGL